MADPPRSIWIHPYEDEQYLQHHPEDRGKLEAWFGPNSRSPSPSGHYPTPAMPATDERGIGGDRTLMAEREREMLDERRFGRELGGGPSGGLFGERSFGDRGFGGGGLLGGLSVDLFFSISIYCISMLNLIFHSAEMNASTAG